jgi:hypothetical protein
MFGSKKKFNSSARRSFMLAVGLIVFFGFLLILRAPATDDVLSDPEITPNQEVRTPFEYELLKYASRISNQVLSNSKTPTFTHKSKMGSG